MLLTQTIILEYIYRIEIHWELLVEFFYNLYEILTLKLLSILVIVLVINCYNILFNITIKTYSIYTINSWSNSTTKIYSIYFYNSVTFYYFLWNLNLTTVMGCFRHKQFYFISFSFSLILFWRLIKKHMTRKSHDRSHNVMS